MRLTPQEVRAFINDLNQIAKEATPSQQRRIDLLLAVLQQSTS